MHNGSMATLEEVLEFYTRGGNFDPERSTSARSSRRSICASTRPTDRTSSRSCAALTDERVRYERAPVRPSRPARSARPRRRQVATSSARARYRTRQRRVPADPRRRRERSRAAARAVPAHPDPGAVAPHAACRGSGRPGAPPPLAEPRTPRVISITSRGEIRSYLRRREVGERAPRSAASRRSPRACWGGARGDLRVGPGQPLAAIGDVPWESLAPGDAVRIHWRAAPYREKWVIGRAGTAAAPIVVRGVPGPGGELPVIDGDGATTREPLDYWNEQRGVIKIGGSNVPPTRCPRTSWSRTWTSGARSPPYTFTDDRRARRRYARNAAAIYVENGAAHHDPQLRPHDSGNGLFSASTTATRGTPGRGQLDPRQRQRRQRLRAQQLHRGDRHRRSSTTASARCAPGAAATT